MRYVLLNRFDEIVAAVDLAGDVGISGAKTYFQGVKQMPDREQFDKLWRVMTKVEHDKILESSTKQYNWWKDIGEGSNLDEW